MNLEPKDSQIARLARDENIDQLTVLLRGGYTQLEIDVGLENAIAYSQTEVAEYLLVLGADFSNYNYQGVYYAVHNDEIEGLKFAVAKGVDVNVRNGMLLNEGIVTAMNTKSVTLVRWLLDNGADPKLLTKTSFEFIDRYGTDELKNLMKSYVKVPPCK